jgi:hypothetical protein
MSSLRTKYPVALSISHFEKSRVGICNDEVNYFVNLFRALGISSYEEIVPLYGNSYSSGHSFFRLEYGEEVYCEGDLINIYKEESIPKVYRRTYSKNKTVNGNICFYIDVTPEYKTTINATIDIAFNNPLSCINPVLCLFHSQDQWIRVAEGVQENNKFVFNEIGTNVLYIAAYYHNGQFNAINYPFFVLPDRTIHYYKPEVEKLDSIIILRKAGLKQPRAAFSRKHWVDSLRYGIFQGANDSSFKDAQLLEGLTELNSTHIQTISVSHNKPFRYIRFWANNHTSFLSLLEFYDVNRKKLAGKIIKSNTMHFFKWQNGAFDDDPLTYTGGSNFTLGLEFDKPRMIGYIRFQSRNDDNHIRPGDRYELLYWEKDWRSLGMQIAADTLLIYHNVPENSILWLRNLTRGKEENIFVMESGKQNFLGFCDE